MGYGIGEQQLEHRSARVESLAGIETLDLVAPFGLGDVFSFRITPNHALDNRETHEAKAVRARAHWPEIEFVPWDIG